MATDPTRQVNSAATWATGLSSLLAGGAKPPAPEPASVLDLLDKIGLSTRPQAPAGADPRVAIALQKIAAGGKPGPLEWQALGKAYAFASGVERSQMAQQLAAGGFRAEIGQDNRYATFTNNTVYVTAEPGSGKLRVSSGANVWCYHEAALVETMTQAGNSVTVTTSAGQEGWDTQSGKGTLNGKPILGRMAPVSPAEPKRVYWQADEQNDLDEPAWDPNMDLGLYGDEYDQAVQQMGGQVIEPSQTDEGEAEQFNCHSYSTTLGEGDLFDPFSRTGFPHWLNNPLHQLTTGNYGRVAPDQRAHVGDVQVYRTTDGTVTHTGVVREVDRDGNPSLVESKFGALGLYLHDPFDIPDQYGGPAELYRPAH
ncbi:MAG: hypothetical protein JWM80_4954 [Cyanobacteria bacterium RYN_339]|nr:hypothetical protein [Cyanobacteria bacterium RYN_339]